MPRNPFLLNNLPQKPTTWYSDLLSLGSGSSGGRRGDSLAETMAKSAARTLGSTVGRQIVRGVLGSLLGRHQAPVGLLRSLLAANVVWPPTSMVDTLSTVGSARLPAR